MPDNEVTELSGQPVGGRRLPRRVYDAGSEPDPLYTLANERTYLAWLRLAVTLLAAAVAVDRLYVQEPFLGSELLSLVLVAVAVLSCVLGVQRWASTELALRLRRPLPGFSTPVLAALALGLVATGVVLLVVVPRG